MEIKKIEKSDFVMFPRMQHRLAGTSAIKATRCGPRPTAQDGGRI